VIDDIFTSLLITIKLFISLEQLSIRLRLFWKPFIYYQIKVINKVINRVYTFQGRLDVDNDKHILILNWFSSIMYQSTIDVYILN
jgi:hypothetical protein